MTKLNFKNDTEAVDKLHQLYKNFFDEVNKAVYGQDEIIKEVLISIFSNGHALLVGVPGLAKTLLVNTIAEVLNLKYRRIQFTPDLMPSDITGAEILDENRQFKFVKGPLFANIILADEINRTPPKTQAALLEAMQERTITAAGINYKLQAPFFVLATQNPIEQEGTYPLPEAQLDRFMMNIVLDYPKFEDELIIVEKTTRKLDYELNKIISGEEIIFFQELIRRLPVSDTVLKYAVNLSVQTRPNTPKAHSLTNEYLEWGAGPRASQYLITGAKTHAALRGKYSPDIEDIQAIAKPVLRHRIVRNYKAEAEGITSDTLIDEFMKL